MIEQRRTTGKPGGNRRRETGDSPRVSLRVSARTQKSPHLSTGAFLDGAKPETLQTPKQKSPNLSTGAFLDLIGRRPTLPHTRACSTIGAEGLNFRVRDGNGWDPFARITQNLLKEIQDPAGSFFCLLTSVS
jgi:hypothetical protein